MKTSHPKTIKGLTVTLLAAASLLPSFRAHAQFNQSYTPFEADAAFQAYNTNFLVQGNGTAYYTTTLKSVSTNPSGGWTGALNIMVAEDAFERTHSAANKQLVSDLCNGFVTLTGTDWSGDGWNDNMEWDCIVLARGYQITGNTTFLNLAANNWNVCYNRGYDNVVGGGIWENQGKGSKNSLSNDPAIVAGCIIYAATKDSTYLTKCQNIYAWMRNNIFNQTTGQVNGEVTASGQLQTSDNVYDSGCFIEAANLLHQATGNAQYYNDAILAINHIVNEGPVIHAPFEAPGNQWAYWFFKGLSDVCTDNNIWNQYYPWMLANANAAWSMRDANNLTWNDWTAPTNANSPPTDAVEMSSAAAIWQQLNVPAQSVIVNDNSGLAMDLISNNTANGAPINQWTVSPNLDGAEHWMVIPTPNGHSAIISAVTAMAATISAASKNNNAPLVDWPYSTGDTSMQFDLVSEGNNWYDIKNVNSGLVLDDAGGNKANNAPIIQWTSNGAGAANQLWKFVPVVSYPGRYEIQCVSSSQALGVSGGSTTNGAAIVQGTYSGAASQLWTFTPTSRGYYRIQNVNSSQALNVSGASLFNSATIVQWPAGGAANDQWFPALNSDGTYTFYNLNSGLVLDNPGGGTQGAQFDQWVTNNGSNQTFNLIAR